MNAPTNRYWVYEGEICRAAQDTFYGALRYWKPGRIITTLPRDENGMPYCPEWLEGK